MWSPSPISSHQLTFPAKVAMQACLGLVTITTYMSKMRDTAITAPDAHVALLYPVHCVDHSMS